MKRIPTIIALALPVAFAAPSLATQGGVLGTVDNGRTQIVFQAADTSDLDPLYKALEPAPDAEYGTWPFAKDRNGVRFAMPEWARSFLKGALDLLAGTKKGELTPDAIGTFTTITSGAGRIIGPRGGADTLDGGANTATGDTASLCRSRLLGVITISGLRKLLCICRRRMWK